jgi:hypothetical protein
MPGYDAENLFGNSEARRGWHFDRFFRLHESEKPRYKPIKLSLRGEPVKL